MRKGDTKLSVVDVIKKSIAFGMGTAAFSAEKLKQFADDMVARGEMTSEEANRFVDEMARKGDDETRSLQNWMREQMSKMRDQVGIAETSRVEALERRVEELERRVAGIAGGAVLSAGPETIEEPPPPTVA